MARDDFDESYQRLQDASNRHAEIAKNPAEFDEIAASHADLLAARDENTRDRRTVVSRREYGAPDHVTPGLGVEGAMSKRTRIMASLGAVVFVVGVAALGWLAVRTVDRPVFVDGPIVEAISAKPDCRWTLEIPVTNSTDAAVTVDNVQVVIDRGHHSYPQSMTRTPIEAGATALVTASFRASACPATTDDIDHGSLWIDWLDSSDSFRQTKHRF